MSRTNEEGILVKSSFTYFLEECPSCLQFSPQSGRIFVIGTYTLIEVPSEDPNDTLDPSPNEFQRTSGDTASPSPHSSAQTTKDTSRQSPVQLLETSNIVPNPSPRQSKNGSLILAYIHQDGSLAYIQNIKTTGAVFDLQFSPSEKSLLAVAMSGGAIKLYKVLLQGSQSRLEHIRDLMVDDPSISITSLAWLPSRSCALAATLSTGDIKIINPHKDAPLLTIMAHSQEAWCTAWCIEETLSDPLLLSGGDDAAFRVYKIGPWTTRSDILVGPVRKDLAENHRLHADINRFGYDVWSEDSRTHQAGVTALLLITEDVFMTGSYDEHVRILRLLKGSKRSVIQAEKNLGGGVWRLKKISERSGKMGIHSTIVLASCMHVGIRVLQITRDCSRNWIIEVKAAFKEHKSMNYASECQPLEKGQKEMKRTIISTSFYDKRICVWHIRVAQLEHGILTVCNDEQLSEDIDSGEVP